MKAKHGIEAVFVDAFKDVARRANGVEGDNEVIAGCCEMAHRLKVRVILTHHVRKASSGLKDNRWATWNIDPADLRGSGRVWDDSRMVIALQMYPEGSQEQETFNYQLHLMKANHGLGGRRSPVERSKWMTWHEKDGALPTIG